MIYEIRTYQIAPGSLAEVEKRFGEAYEYRKKYSPLTAFWHTEVGPLNEIIHVWGYNDLAERAKVRAEAAKDANWPPKISEFIRKMRAEIVNAFDFVPTPTPGKMGPIFEIRYYTLKGGTLPATAEGWKAQAAGPHQALAGRPRGRRGVRQGQRLRAHLGVPEHGPADAGSRRGAQEGRVAAAGRRRPSDHRSRTRS